MTHKQSILFLEYQNDFLGKEGILSPMIQEGSGAGFLDRSTDLLAFSRQNEVPVFHVPLVNTDEPINTYGILDTVANSGAFKPGSWGHSFIPEMTPIETETIIQNKSGISAFQGTQLDEHLQEHDITDLYIAGLLTHICIESTVRDAYDRGYNVTVIKDAVTSIDATAHQHSLESTLPLFAKISSTEDVKSTLLKGVYHGV